MAEVNPLKVSIRSFRKSLAKRALKQQNQRIEEDGLNLLPFSLQFQEINENLSNN